VKTHRECIDIHLLCSTKLFTLLRNLLKAADINTRTLTQT